MKKVSYYIEEITKDKAKEAKLKSLIEEAMEYLEIAHPQHYMTIMCSLHCLAYGAHFDRETAESAVARMVNVDGTVGEHWTFEEIKSLAGKNGISNCADLYYVMNMLYSDTKSVIGSNDKMYLELAKAMYFTDPDMVEGKPFLQWSAMQKC